MKLPTIPPGPPGVRGDFDSSGNLRGLKNRNNVTVPLLSSRLTSSNLQSNLPVLNQYTANERGSSGTWHSTIEVAADVAYVQPIVFVTRDPADPTYTSDDTYEFLGVAPTATMTDVNGQPNPTGGNSAWVTTANAVFSRQIGASTSAPIPVAGPIIPVTTIPRTDGGNGRLLMARAYTAATGSTTRQPTYGIQVNDGSLWDSAFPLVGQNKHYYASGNFVSANQSNFSTSGAPATRWQYQCIIGLKCMYSAPVLHVVVAGDSIEAGAHAETGVPTMASFTQRAIESLRAIGYNANLSNIAVSGYSWDQFTPIANVYLPILKPDVLIIPSYTPNGVNTAHTTGIGNTVADALLHWAKCLTLRDTALAAGVKTVIVLTPPPSGATGSPTNRVPRDLIRSWVLASGMPCIDLFVLAGSDYGFNQTYRFDDQTHPNGVANALIASGQLVNLIRSLIPL